MYVNAAMKFGSTWLVLPTIVSIDEPGKDNDGFGGPPYWNVRVWTNERVSPIEFSYMTEPAAWELHGQIRQAVNDWHKAKD